MHTCFFFRELRIKIILKLAKLVKVFFYIHFKELYMSQTLNNLRSLPPLTGIDTFLFVMGSSRLSYEDDEVGVPERPLRTLVRIIFTSITLPFFSAMGTVYNATVSASKFLLGCISIVGRNYLELDHPKSYFNDSFYHLCMGILDFSILYAFPAVVMTYSLFPMESSRLYHGMVNWIRKPN